MSIISWSLEFITGGLVMCCLLYIDDIDGASRSLIVVDVFLCSILIPSIYVLKSDSIKEVIITRGWLPPFINLLPTIFDCLLFNGLRCCRRSIAPIEEIDMIDRPNVNQARLEVQPAIVIRMGQIEKDLVIEDM